MTELHLEGVGDGPLLGLDARLGAGCSVVLGSDPMALATLVAVAAGTQVPRRGRALLDGATLHGNPALRRSTAALLAEEALPEVGRVRDAVELVLRARGERRSPESLLADAGLETLGPRLTRDLGASERRTLALAIALSHPSPRLVSLYEPLAAGRGLSAEKVLSGIGRAVAGGAVVLVATASLEDARSLGGSPWLLDGGVLSAATTPLGPPEGGEQTLVVETSDARRLTAALARDPAVRGVRWDEQHAPETVSLLGVDVEALASAVARALSEESLSVRSMTLAPAPLEALLAARSGAARAYYDLAYRAQSGGAAPGSGHYGAAPSGAARGDAMAPAPANQAVGMPSTFAEPTRPSGGGHGA